MKLFMFYAKSDSLLSGFAVAPFVGAWVEIWTIISFSGAGMSLPSWERVSISCRRRGGRGDDFGKMNLILEQGDAGWNLNCNGVATVAEC